MLLIYFLFIIPTFCSNYWNCNIPYKMGSYNNIEVITKAKSVINRITNWNLVEYTNETDYIVVNSGKYCSGNYGKVSGQNIITMDDNCGIINFIHEFFHLLGFEHEHNRYDRDNYITIHKENIEDSLLSNFYKINYKDIFFNYSYDYESIMHYGVFSLTKNNLQTMSILNDDVLNNIYIGQTFKVSEIDIEKVNYLASLIDCPYKSLKPFCSTDDLLFFSGNTINLENRINTYFVKHSYGLYFSEYRNNVFLLVNYFNFNIIFIDYTVQAYKFNSDIISNNWNIKSKATNSFYSIENSKMSNRECNETISREYVFNNYSILIYFIIYFIIPLSLLLFLCLIVKLFFIIKIKLT